MYIDTLPFVFQGTGLMHTIFTFLTQKPRTKCSQQEQIPWIAINNCRVTCP